MPVAVPGLLDTDTAEARRLRSTIDKHGIDIVDWCDFNPIVTDQEFDALHSLKISTVDNSLTGAGLEITCRLIKGLPVDIWEVGGRYVKTLFGCIYSDIGVSSYSVQTIVPDTEINTIYLCQPLLLTVRELYDFLDGS